MQTNECQLFVLNHAHELFQGRYLLRKDELRGGYWAIFVRGIAYIPEPVYDFNWPSISEELVEKLYPKHYKNYNFHEFLFKESTQEKMTISFAKKFELTATIPKEMEDLVGEYSKTSLLMSGQPNSLELENFIESGKTYKITIEEERS